MIDDEAEPADDKMDPVAASPSAAAAAVAAGPVAIVPAPFSTRFAVLLPAPTYFPGDWPLPLGPGVVERPARIFESSVLFNGPTAAITEGAVDWLRYRPKDHRSAHLRGPEWTFYQEWLEFHFAGFRFSGEGMYSFGEHIPAIDLLAACTRLAAAGLLRLDRMHIGGWGKDGMPFDMFYFSRSPPPPPLYFHYF